MAFQLSTQTTPPTNPSSGSTPNTTDPCMRHTGALLPPLSPSTPYIAIGPVSNFTAPLQSCCPNKTPTAIQNYRGGPNRNDDDAPLSCYYYCAFNGTYADVEAALNCTKRVAEGEGKYGVGVLAASLDWPGESAGRRSGGGGGVWKWVVLGLVIVGAGGL